VADDYVVYRAPGVLIGSVASTMALAVFVLLLRMSLDGVGDGVLFWVGLAMALFFGALLVLIVRSVTVVDAGGIEVRQMFSGRRHYPWAEIADIQTAPMDGTRVTGAVLFDAELCRVFLPQLTDKVLGAERLDGEVARLRQWWAAARGDDFQPRAAEVAAGVAAHRAKFWKPQRIGLAVGVVIGVTFGILMAVL
jgi:hypothetical protein